MDYGGNSIGVGLVTWGFFSPARHQPPDHETADREATSSAQKYSQTIATSSAEKYSLTIATTITMLGSLPTLGPTVT